MFPVWVVLRGRDCPRTADTPNVNARIRNVKVVFITASSLRGNRPVPDVEPRVGIPLDPDVLPRAVVFLQECQRNIPPPVGIGSARYWNCRVPGDAPVDRALAVGGCAEGLLRTASRAEPRAHPLEPPPLLGAPIIREKLNPCGRVVVHLHLHVAGVG